MAWKDRDFTYPVRVSKDAPVVQDLPTLTTAIHAFVEEFRHGRFEMLRTIEHGATRTVVVASVIAIECRQQSTLHLRVRPP